MAEDRLIVVVGGADTGRAPIAAALLRRRLAAAGYRARVESAGVLGHDDAPAQSEARGALATLGLDLDAHRARSLSDELANEARLLLAIDGGTLLVLHARLTNCEHCRSLAALAGVQRDIPDPFRMQLGAWLTYSHEIDRLLGAALPQIVRLADLASADSPVPNTQPIAQPALPELRASGSALERLLAALAEFPNLFDWPATRQRLEREAELAATGELGSALAALIRTLLILTPARPSAGQVRVLQDAAERLEAGPSQNDVAALSAQVARWQNIE